MSATLSDSLIVECSNKSTKTLEIPSPLFVAAFSATYALSTKGSPNPPPPGAALFFKGTLGTTPPQSRRASEVASLEKEERKGLDCNHGQDGSLK